MRPLLLGLAAGAVAGAGSLWAGAPALAAFAAYSLVGAAGLLAGAMLNLREGASNPAGGDRPREAAVGSLRAEGTRR